MQAYANRRQIHPFCIFTYINHQKLLALRCYFQNFHNTTQVQRGIFAARVREPKIKGYQ